MNKKIVSALTIGLAFALLAGCSNPAAPDTTELQLAIPGVPRPSTGAAPVTSLDTDQYTGTISWSPDVSSYFVSNTEYTAVISLTPREGYSFENVAADSFTVSGASAKHQAGSGNMTVNFPKTIVNTGAAVDITSSNIGTLKAVQGGSFLTPGGIEMKVSTFHMSRYEITGDQFAAVLQTADPSHFTSVANHPVERVSWYDTLVFCNKLSELEGLTKVYSINIQEPVSGYPVTKATVEIDWTANGYRLPTRSEWIFAARGGNLSHDYPYAGSDDINAVAWTSTNCGSKTHTVGTKMPNELGLYDMTGNVAEWTWDKYNTYFPSAPQTDYRGVDGDIDSPITNHPVCGGSWGEINGAELLEIMKQAHFTSQHGNYYYGFRVVRN